MKQLFFITFCLLINLLTHAQSPVTWKYSAKKIADKTYEVHMTAKVDDPWHIYSQQTPEGGPLPTAFVFTKNPLVVLEGNIKENGNMQMVHDPVFGIDVMYYTEKVDFVQIVNLKAGIKTSLSGTVKFMVCNEHQCMPPASEKFTIALP